MRDHVNSRARILSSAKPCVFTGLVGSEVAKVGSVVPQVRASIWEKIH